MTEAGEIILYTKQHDCAPCLEAKRFLADHNVSYVEKDVENNRDNLMELVKQYRIMTVPVLIVNNTPLKGFDKQEYAAALGLA
jgi:glutaredoxin 3